MVLSKVKAFAIYFDHLNEHHLPVFSGGDQISGRVVVEVTEEVRVRSLTVHARGVAKVRWTESRNTGANTAYTQNYTEEVEYLNHYDTLIGEEEEERDDESPDEGSTILCTGVHEFAFSLNLPQMPLATSFEGKHGSVRYWVKAELQRSWLLPVKVKKEFIVFEHIDINTPLLLTFYAKGKGKQIQQLVANLRGDPLPQGKSQSWEGKSLKIPPVSPSIIDCPIIRVEYALMVYVDVPGGLNLNLSLPLVIGTIPLHACSSRTSTLPSRTLWRAKEEEAGADTALALALRQGVAAQVGHQLLDLLALALGVEGLRLVQGGLGDDHA
ncbi:hypothetical protein CRUP_026099 [Coryphaenoides rupestris]|nr:hypothetical protein CRUP_026099 [Coryphaenoides rupestris]